MIKNKRQDIQIENYIAVLNFLMFMFVSVHQCRFLGSLQTHITFVLYHRLCRCSGGSHNVKCETLEGDQSLNTALITK